MDPQDVHERLVNINAMAKRVERTARMLKQESAKLIEGTAEHTTAEEAHEDGSSNRDTHS